MTRSAKIAEIHAQRGRDSATAEALRAHLAAVGVCLDDIERMRTDLLPRVEDEARERLQSLGAPLRELSDRIALEQSALERVLARLHRPTLNIGVVGRARQGKSRFLQSLTGLSAREIPDGRGNFCTGVPSVIQHMPGGATYADIFFHSSGSFLGEVIGPYYKQLGLGRVPSHPLEFGTKPLPPLNPGQAGAETEATYGHLTTYHEMFGDYQGLIGAASPRRVKAEDIRSYVAQDDAAGRRQLHTFRAVRRVHIFTGFPQDDLGGLGVIDLPGLGDTNLGDSRLLLSALRDDVDLVLFLRKPNPDRDSVLEVDVRLYDTAQLALPELPLNRCSFLILNHRRSPDAGLDNLPLALEFAEKAADRGIRVAKTIITDCSSIEEVKEAFSPVVDYLLANIGELDQLLLAERSRRVAEICEEACLLAKDAAAVSDLAQPASVWFPHFRALFEGVYQDLADGLASLARSCQNDRDRPSPILEEAVTATLKQAREDDGLPDTAEVGRQFAVHGQQVAAWSHLLDKARAHLSRHFLSLDVVLAECVQRMWGDVSRVLRGAGRLERLTSERDREFLVYLAERVPPDVRLDRASEVAYSLRMLADFELSYRGFIQHRIRPCLDGMNADHPDIDFPRDGTEPGEEIVRDMIAESYHKALYQCEMKLIELVSEPSEAIFAIVEEFGDRVLRSHRIQAEWEAIYQALRVDIWPGEFAALGEQTVDLRDWTDVIHRLTRLLSQNPGEDR